MQDVPKHLFVTRPFGTWDWPLYYATAELAIMECLVELKTEVQFQQMDRWFESTSSLSPTKLQQLLLLCSNIKARRLLGWFASRHQHVWTTKLDWSTVGMGSGKRSIIKGVSFNTQWQITVPSKLENDNHDGSEQSLF